MEETKEGFVPQEDVPVYEINTPVAKQTAKGQEGNEIGLSKTAKKILTCKEKRKKQQEKKGQDTDDLIQSLEKTTMSELAHSCGDGKLAGQAGNARPPASSSDASSPTAILEKNKKVKNLKKKLQQVEDL